MSKIFGAKQLGMLHNVSIIIPVAPDETYHEQLLNDLKHSEAQIILSHGYSRAHSLNKGVEKALRPFLWFVHADSRITQENLSALKDSLNTTPNALHYFDLAFDGGVMLNAWGANMRSCLFGLPFGDQGLCIAKTHFIAYREDLPYGEDLMFVWDIRHAGIKLHRISSSLLTSARKYKQRGRLKLMLLYQWRWIMMSLPEFWKVLKRTVLHRRL